MWSKIQKKPVSFDDIVHFLDEQNIVIFVDSDYCFTFYAQIPKKIIQINRKRSYVSRHCEKLKCIPSNDQHNFSADEQHTCIIFLNPYSLWDMVRAALMSLSLTNDTYSTFNQHPQPTTQQPRADSYPLFSSLRTMNSKSKGLRVSFAFF